MTDLDARLARGPLRVQNLWSGGSSDVFARRILRRRRMWFALDIGALCVSIALGIVAFLPGHGSVRAPTLLATRVTTFADGSTAELWSVESDLRIQQDTAGRVVATLTGGARFQVVPNHARPFEVRSGDVRVRVLGTIFSVQQLPSMQVQVFVERGRVEVGWLGGSTVLQSGQGGTFPPPAGAEAEPDAGALPEAIASPSPSARIAVVGSSADGWRDDARAGDYKAAYEELHAKGREAVGDNADDLMLSADVARLSAHPADAVAPLRALCDRHSGDRRAPIAAFTLGRVLLDDLERPADAAAAFQKARALWPLGPLAADALAREADAWQRAGRPGVARKKAEDYVARYPEGPHVAAMRQILAP